MPDVDTHQRWHGHHHHFNMNRCTILLAPIAATVAVVMCARIVVEVMVTAVHDAIVGDPVRREAEIGAALAEMWGA